MIIPAVAVALLSFALPVQVESEGCPSVGDVEHALAGMLPPASETNRPDVARILRRDGKLRVELTDADAAIIAERSIDRDGSCAELAALAAVVIASWESDVHPAFARPQVEPVAVLRPPVPVPTPIPPVAAYDVSAGVVLSTAGSLAVGANLGLCWVPRGTGLGLRASFEGETTRTLDVGRGHAKWRRWQGSAELDWRLSVGPTLDFHGGFALSWLTTEGNGFDINRPAGSISPGGTVGARLSWWTSGRLSFWIEATAVYWTRTQTVFALPGTERPEIPRFQGLASVGVAWGRLSASR